jgi:hypothetical protein
MKRAFLMLVCFAAGIASWAEWTAYRERQKEYAPGIPTFEQFLKQGGASPKVGQFSAADIAPSADPEIDNLRKRIAALEARMDASK